MKNIYTYSPFALSLFLGICILASASAAYADDPYEMFDRMAYESEIKAIVQVQTVRNLTGYRDGTFATVTFKRIYGASPLVPRRFEAGCRILQQKWQIRSPEFVYFNPKKGQRVFLTASGPAGAITSYTLLTPALEKQIRTDVDAISFRKGKAILPEPME